MTFVYLSDMQVQYYIDAGHGFPTGYYNFASADILSSAGIDISFGIAGNGPLDRVASTGKMTFTLRNDRWNTSGNLGYYSPLGANALQFLDAGRRVRLRVVYDGNYYVRFWGRIPHNGIEVEGGALGTKRTKVTVLDYMDQLATHRLYLTSVTSNKKLTDVVDLILANMAIQPRATSYGIVQDTFPGVFDQVREKTTALGELTKAVVSEMGYAFIKHLPTDSSSTGVDGECLTIQGRFTRSNTMLAQIPETSTSAIYLDTEADEDLLTEAGDNIILDSTRDASFGAGNLNLMDIRVTHGANLYNQIRYTSHPVYTDKDPVVLFTLQTTIYIAPADQIDNVIGRYRDPVGGAARVSGIDMIAPAATTDYLFNTQADGGGTNITADLSVTANYGAEGVNYTLKNNGAVDGYVTLLQARGYGIYTYDPVTLMIEDSASEDINGVRTLALDLRYQRNIETSQAFAINYLNRYKDPITEAVSITYLANYDEYHMMAFLTLNIGNRIEVHDEVSAVAGEYFINSISYRIIDKLIYVTYGLASAANDNFIYWMLDRVGRAELGVNTILGF